MPDPADPSKHHGCIEAFRSQTMMPIMTAVPPVAVFELACDLPAAPSGPDPIAQTIPVDDSVDLPPVLRAPFKVPIA